MSRLDELNLDIKISRERYESELDDFQEDISRLAIRNYSKKRSLVVVFEGMDAAGKGGAIRRITQALDPELYRVITSAAPNEAERAHHYLWRYWTRMPEPGMLALFDRSWYGRVLVERVEGFAKEEEWRRAYDEINEMELAWTNSGIKVLKFWLHIDLDEQHDRFKAREASPLKNWKLTEEDWRNREKWPQYKAAIEEMLERTSTGFAPWQLVEANDKLFARTKVLRLVRAAMMEM